MYNICWTNKILLCNYTQYFFFLILLLTNCTVSLFFNLLLCDNVESEAFTWITNLWVSLMKKEYAIFYLFSVLSLNALYNPQQHQACWESSTKWLQTELLSWRFFIWDSVFLNLVVNFLSKCDFYQIVWQTILEIKITLDYFPLNTFRSLLYYVHTWTCAACGKI